MDTQNILKLHKDKIVKIIDEFQIYYEQNNADWDIKDTSAAHQILGTLILTYKKLEYMEQSLEYFVKNDLMDLFNIQIEEVKIVTDYYQDIFMEKGA